LERGIDVSDGIVSSASAFFAGGFSPAVHIRRLDPFTSPRSIASIACVGMAKMLDLMRSLTAVLATAFIYSFPQVGAQQVDPYNYTIINGQIFTPGLAIVDAPQPNTPLGGGTPFFPSPLFTVSPLTQSTQRTCTSPSMWATMAP
jgi:hypothetical protein